MLYSPGFVGAKIKYYYYCNYVLVLGSDAHVTTPIYGYTIHSMETKSLGVECESQ